MLRPTLSIASALFLMPAAVTASEQGDPVKGLEIAKARYEKFNGYQDYQVSQTMTLFNANGDSTVFKMRSKSLAVENDGDKSLSLFDYPRDKKGIVLLTHTRRIGDDDSMLYLPALKRVKRIVASNKSGPYMGSDFAYEDLGSKEIEKADYFYLGEEQLDGQSAYKMKRIPKSKNSGYSKMLVWTDTQDFRILRADYYDRKDELLKTLDYSDFKLYEERFWRAHKSVMTNHQTNTKTEIVIDDIQFNNGFDAREFERNALKRAR